ncbi:MAG: phospho-sugar mutase [Acidimicrobiales bacterium]
MAAGTLPADLAGQVDAWLAIDPDPGTRGELERLVATDPERVAALFDGRVAFGTAGLRAAMGPGPTRMNRVVVAQATAGVMRWLPAGARVVIGYDARHNSATFARDVATMVVAAGGTAELLPGPLPTPVLARAVLARHADAGVMITASHNPAADNGYKLYLADGIQLVSPADTEIAALIDAVAAEGADLLGAGSPSAAPGGSPAPSTGRSGVAGSEVVLGDEVAADHVAAVAAACLTGERDVRVLYSAMHGVAGRHLLAAFAQAGFPTPDVVPEQFDPDPDFPTVAFPNPEEAGALDLAFARAAVTGPDVILANDPDGDRLAVAVPDRSGRRWVRLSGDQVGALLADHVMNHTSGPNRLVASSLVSSRLISALAEAEGVADVRTLTGFKWVARPIVERPDRRYLLGYEEALGYCVGDRVRDKDGISAAVVMAELVAEALRRRETLWDRLDRLASRLGVYLTGPVTLTFEGDDGLSLRSAAMAAAAADPPSELAGVAVIEVEDLSRGERLPPTPGVIWHLADRSRVIVRPSGTEPKLKAYVEVIEPVSDAGGGVPTATAAAEERLARLQAAVHARLT